MTPYPEPPPYENEMAATPFDADAESDLVGAVLNDPQAFEMANLKSEDFFIHRRRWVWEACERIRADGDIPDYETIHKYLEKSGHWEEVNAREPLEDARINTLAHVVANANRVREMAERRRIVARKTEEVKQALDLSIPLPAMPSPIQTHWTMEQLAEATFHEPEGPVPGIIPNGLTLLGGRPKRGKSWFMLQAGCMVGTGGRFLERDLPRGYVLYYALEDRPKRLKDRTEKLGIPFDALIEFELAIKPLHLGGMAEIENAARSGKYSMIVIDTIRRALPGRDFNKDGALFDDFLSKLQSLAQQEQLAIVCILHTRKSSSGFDPDPVDDVLGSTGLTASADQVLALYTEQGKKGATLKGRGRDLEDIDLTLEFDKDTGCWQSKGESGEVKAAESENDILAVLSDVDKAQAQTIAKTLGKDYGNTHRRIKALWTAGKIRKEMVEGKTYYFLPRGMEDKEVST